MPRKPRNPGSGKAPYNGPAQGASLSGAGWGGEANGAGNTGPGPGRPEGVLNGQGKKARAEAALTEAVEMAVQTVINIASDTTDQRALAAAQHILLRVMGDPAKRVELTGADGGALEIVRRIVDPKDAE